MVTLHDFFFLKSHSHFRFPSHHTLVHSQEKELKYTVKLEDMKVKDVEASRFSIGKKYVFALFYTTGR